MKISKRTGLLCGLLIIGIVVVLALQSPVVRNLRYALSYELTLDRYSQSDTTTTNIRNNKDLSGRTATLLSAFFGADNGMPMLASLVVCEGADNQDGMPVVFSHEVDVTTLDPGDFKITRSSGKTGEITCLTLAPADDKSELRTVLLVGEYGSVEDQPVAVEIIGNILSLDQTMNFKGTSVSVEPLEAGPSLVLATILPEKEWALTHSGTPLPWGGGSGCPAGTNQVVRVTWNGGITKPDGTPAGEVERLLYQVTVKKPDNTTETIAPYALGDLSDGDNNHKLCLDTTYPAVSVAFPAGHLTDPIDDLNPATRIDIAGSSSAPVR